MEAASALGPWKDVAMAEYRPLLEYVLGLVRDVALAEDITQVAMLKGMQAWASFEPKSTAKVRPWLRRIAKNTAIDYFRQQQRQRLDPLSEDRDEVVDTNTPSPEEVFHEEQLHHLCIKLAAVLPTRTVQFMKVWARQSYGDALGSRISANEAARMLGVTFDEYENEKKRVKTAVMAALRQLEHDTRKATRAHPA